MLGFAIMIGLETGYVNQAANDRGVKMPVVGVGGY